MTVLSVLVACEFSGRVRDAFITRGHDAISCDVLPSETPGPHIQGDVLALPHYEYDLMVAFPPCTYLSYAGARWWRDPGRAALQTQAVEFVRQLMALPIPRWAIENPRGMLNRAIRLPDQRIEPWWFGEAMTKKTYLWLHNLPPLMASCVHPDPFVNWTKIRGGSGHDRSRTFQGVANAMAQQWGEHPATPQPSQQRTRGGRG